MSTANARHMRGEEPLGLPFPGPEFRRLDLRQSTIAWAVGLIIGIVVATAVIALLMI